MLTSEVRCLKFLSSFELVNKFMISNAYKLPNFDKLVINLNIQNQDSFTSYFYPRALFFLELFTGHKSFISVFKKSLKGKKTYKILFSSQVTLRGRYFYQAIYLLLLFIIPTAEAKFLRFNRVLSDTASYYFSIRDASVLPGTLENFFKWEYPVNFYLMTTGASALQRKTLLTYSGFWF